MGFLLNECFHKLQKYTAYISFNIMIYEYDSNDLIIYNR